MIVKPIFIAVLALVGFSSWADPVSSSSSEVTTPLEKYRCYVHDTIGPNWHHEMERNKTGLRYGKVKIRFTVHADGSVSNFSILIGESAGLLKTVSINVLLASAPFKPFDDALIQEMGRCYVDEYTFSVNRSRTGNRPAEGEPRVPPPPSD